MGVVLGAIFAQIHKPLSAHLGQHNVTLFHIAFYSEFTIGLPQLMENWKIFRPIGQGQVEKFLVSPILHVSQVVSGNYRNLLHQNDGYTEIMLNYAEQT